MADLGLTKDDIRIGANFPNQTIVTNLIEGRARMELKYVADVAKVLQVDNDYLMSLAVGGFLNEDDEKHFRKTQSDLEIMRLRELCNMLGERLQEAAEVHSQLIIMQKN